MIFEKSCGAVIFTRRDGKRLYLLEHMKKGHTSICKGHVEGEETEHETARREIREETALDVTFIEGFRRTITYSPYEGCRKDVVFFLAEAAETGSYAQPEEVDSVEWLEYGEALPALTHESDRETLMAAEAFLASPPVFRPMRRGDRQMSGEKCLEVLERGSSGVLALLGDGGYPYAVPLNYVYHDGSIFFHGAGTGHRPDAVRAGERASFCVVDREETDPAHYTTRYRSVIAFGSIRELDNEGEKRRAIGLLARKYNPGDTPEHRNRYIDSDFGALWMAELRCHHVTGKENSPQ